MISHDGNRKTIKSVNVEEVRLVYGTRQRIFDFVATGLNGKDYYQSKFYGILNRNLMIEGLPADSTKDCDPIGFEDTINICSGPIKLTPI